MAVLNVQNHAGSFAYYSPLTTHCVYLIFRETNISRACYIFLDRFPAFMIGVASHLSLYYANQLAEFLMLLVTGAQS